MAKRLTNEEFLNRLNDYTNNSVELLTEYKNKKTKVLIKCKKCNYKWEISPTRLYGNYHFDGCPQCKYTEIECSYCGKRFSRLKSEIRNTQSGFHYCSRECGNRHKNSFITNNEDGHAYRRNAFNNYEHKCELCGWDEDERVLEVHHIDENRNNNNIKNLMILCPICHKKLTLHLIELENRQIK